MLIVLTVVSTSYEIYEKLMDSQTVAENNQKTNVCEKLWTSFSILRNTRLLFIKNSNFEALDTIRLFIILIMVLCHEYFFYIYIPLAHKNVQKLYEIYYDNRYSLLRNPLHTDILFTLR